MMELEVLKQRASLQRAPRSCGPVLGDLSLIINLFLHLFLCLLLVAVVQTPRVIIMVG
jgi:hypothetical protein